MSNWIIETEGLGKKYSLRHLGASRGYVTLREAVVYGFKRLLQPTKLPKSASEDFWALRDLSFSVKESETVAIIGRNGAGKSTLLKILSRITEPTEGRVRLRGRVASLLEVGTGFHPELTGRENIFLNGSILGMSKAEIKRKFDEIVAFSEVEKFLDTPVKRYSSGMYVRLAFAVAAHLEPEILIVDEVLAVGDAEFQRKCLGKMRDVSRAGRTVLFVSHNLAAVRTLCSRALLLQNGRIVADSGAATVVSAYMADVSTGVRLWSAPDGEPEFQNESAVIRTVTVRGTEGQLLDELTTSTAFTIDIDFRTKHDGAFVGLTVIIYDAEHNCVLSSLSNLEPDWYGRPMP